MKRPLLLSPLVILCTIYFAGRAFAADACCRGHGGMCGCRCCDGKPLSKRCAEKHTECPADARSAARSGRRADRRSDPPVDPESATEEDDSLPQAEAMADPVYEDFSGEIKRVTDGGNLTVLRDQIPVKVRLFAVVCPRISQPFGRAAREFTVQAIRRHPVSVKVVGVDETGRVLGEVTTSDGKSLSARLIQAGLAWWDSRTAPVERELETLDTEARATRTGLWLDDDPIPPWQWKKPKKYESDPFAQFDEPGPAPDQPRRGSRERPRLLRKPRTRAAAVRRSLSRP
jgi:endonuclease YncB( thermonuclease family)